MTKVKRQFHLEPADAPLNGARSCDWPQCGGDGAHRAPRSRQEMKSYRWFCLEHIRVYNKSWNYYDGMTDDEVEADVRMDNVGRRPSWPLGSNRLAYAFNAHAFDAGAAFNDFGGFNGGGYKPRNGRKALTAEEKAMAVLDLLPPVTLSTVKARYKELVKRHHPDANNGDKASEEKFKQISQAYETVIAYLET